MTPQRKITRKDGQFPAAFFALVIILLSTLAGCKQKHEAKDYSQTESVSVTLKKSSHENGLRQVEPRQEGRTSPASVGGSECRSLKTPENKEGFIYFLLDPSFKSTNAENVKIMVEYFDATQGSFSLDYDSVAGAYTKGPAIIRLARSLKWETAEFVVRNARFQNLQDFNADFRLRIKVPEFFIRRVQVLRDTGSEPAMAIGSNSQAVPVQPQSTEVAPSVSILFSEPPAEKGLHLVNYPDGQSIPAKMAGQPCRKVPGLVSNYLYFAIDSAFKGATNMQVQVDVDYYAAAPGSLQIHYDSWNSGPKDGAYTRSPRKISLRPEDRWQTESFMLPQARFENRQNEKSDFRLNVTSRDFYVRQVTVRKYELYRPGFYTESNAVGTSLGKNNSSDGLEQVLQPDSVFKPATVEGQECVSVQPAEGETKGYLYFRIDSSFNRPDLTNAVVEVQYNAVSSTRFHVQYNASGNKTSPGDAYRDSSYATRSPAGWKKAYFYLSNARFENLQNGNADFRVEIYAPSFYVRKVILRRGANE